MIQRCTDQNADNYSRYGGRGIRVADEWSGEDGFERFIAHIGPRPSNDYSVDRIDNSKGYEPGNVRWATDEEQRRNRSDNRMITINGRTLCATDWEREFGLAHGLIYARIEELGWSPEEAVTRPVKNKRFVMFNGVQLPMRQLSRELFGHSALIESRISRGWTIERAVSEPVDVSSRNHRKKKGRT